MKENKYNILVDLSVAVLGNSGLPLDAKWLFKQLLYSNRNNVSGLVYPLDWQNINFTLNGASEEAKTLLYSLYLCYFELNEQKALLGIEKLFLVRFVRKLEFFRKILFKNHFSLWLKNTKRFNDVIYRIFFESGLDPKDRELIENANYYFTDFFKYLVHYRLTKSIPVKLPKLDTHGFDFIVHQDSIPVAVSKGTHKIIRYHDPVPLLSPDLTQESQESAIYHYKSIEACINQGAIYVCNSEPVEKELLGLFPKLKGKTTTIPYTISEVYSPQKDSNMLFDILESKFSSKFLHYKDIWRDIFSKAKKNPKSFKYITQVCTIEPRKNYLKLFRAFSLAKSKLMKDGIELKLIIAGGLGWKYEKILKELDPLVASGDVALMENLHPNELKYLYSHAQAFIFPSFKEGFGLPPVEAMLCETPIISSDIEVHRWVQGSTSFYVDPYNYEEIAQKIVYVLQNRDSEEMKVRIRKGRERAQRYNARDNEKKWNAFFDDVKNGKYSNDK